jgi:hypothetical protein
VQTKTCGIGGVSEICQPYVPLLVRTISICIRWLLRQCDKVGNSNADHYYLVSSTETTQHGVLGVLQL